MTPRSLIAPARLARAPVLATQSDERLVDLVRAGHESAFETIVARYRGALLRYAEGFLGGDRAEDAVQQAFVRAYDAMQRDDAELNLRPWLYRIVHNTALNSLRDRALQHGELPEDIDGVERPDQALERTQSLRAVLGAVATLPPRQRDAIVLRELEGRSYEEIAGELGVSGGAVRQLLNRARNTVRSAATAVVPIGLVSRLPWATSSEPVAARVAEWSAAAGAGAVATKVCATALVTGAIVGGGVAVAPEGPDERAAAPDMAPVAPQRPEGPRPASSAPAPPAPVPDESGRGGERRDDDDRSGPGDGERRESERDDRSGERDGNDDRPSRSGPSGGDVDDARADDSSGPSDDSSGPSDDSSGPEDSSRPEVEDESSSGSSGSGPSGSGNSGSDGPEPEEPEDSG